MNRLIAQLALLLAALPVVLSGKAFADPTSVSLAGTFQTALGCSGNWSTNCANSSLVKTGSDWSASFLIPAGNWEYKVTLNGSWDESYGYNQGSSNATFSLASEKWVTFTYNQDTHLLTDTALSDTPVIDPQPVSVGIAGNLQHVIGCAGDWDPACSASQLILGSDKVWRQTFNVPAGDWLFKAALNGGWDENYGANTRAGGDNISLVLASPRAVTFYYSHKTHWVTSNVNSVIASAVGNFQTALGCPGDWQPECLRGWLQDTNGSGLYTFSTTAIPVGNYEAKVALNETWAESYGDDGNNIAFSVTHEKQNVVFTYDAAHHKVYIGDSVVTGNLRAAKAYWLNRDTVALNITAEQAASGNIKLHYSSSAALSSGPSGIDSGESINLTYMPAGLSDALKAKFPHLKNLAAFKIAAGDVSKVAQILRQQTAISISASNGNLIDATGLQIAGVLDDLFSYKGDLGVIYADGKPSLKLWAPTAASIKLHLYDQPSGGSETSSVAMQFDAATGVWTATGDASWNRKYYLYEVEVYSRPTGHIEHYWVTDPYSLGLSTNGQRSLIVNLSDADLKPEGWDSLAKPVLNAPEDIAIYELHIRDFSIIDSSVPEAERGTFMAFAHSDTNGMKHLKNLTDAGLTHIHLLPAFDCASVNEIKAQQKVVVGDLASLAADSESQQAAINSIRGEDGFNWCYDPFHYTVPDGSYATDPEGVVRIKEFRSMVSGLSKAGLRVVMDVVYNHTSGALQSETAVLDKVVPGYYHRLNANGDIENSTCCANTASENAMMEKLMLDSMKTWATQYKVDGFRYDLMGHHSKANITNIKTELQKLTVAQDGVKGSDLYFYGEGWNFGEVQDNSRFVQATIGNMGGTGVGTFNDRIRDAVRGGYCCDSGLDLVQRQGFITGLYTAPNAENSASESARSDLLRAQDRLKVALAGSLADYSFTDRTGTTITAAQLDNAGYTQDPSETINYAEAHDNETLFDIIQYKAPLDTSMADRVRMQTMGNAFVLLAQGVPFLHAGQDMLRSKSFDRNSYDSGDWFNALDFTYQHNNWGKGLPLAQDNQGSWDYMKARLANPALAPASEDIVRANAQTRELLKVRKSSKLFRLETAEQIKSVVSFYNNGANQVPGVVAMNLKDTVANLDPNVEDILVVFNANTTNKTLAVSELKGWEFALHAVQAASDDDRLKQASVDNAKAEFTVPARTVAVFVTNKKLTDTSIPVTPDPKPTKSKAGGSIVFAQLMDAWLCLMLVVIGVWRTRSS